MGLCDKFATVRGQILLTEPLPPINKVFHWFYNKNKKDDTYNPLITLMLFLSVAVPVPSLTKRATTKREDSYVNVAGNNIKH